MTIRAIAVVAALLTVISPIGFPQRLCAQMQQQKVAGVLNWAGFGMPAAATKNFGDIPFVQCPPGKFKMGYPSKGEKEVTLSHGFWIGKYEVTQAQYQSVMEKNPSNFKDDGGSHPVENVSWTEAVEYCKKLTNKGHEEGWLPNNRKIALPTEAQWEYACRAGTTAAFSFGDDQKLLGQYAWIKENSKNQTHPVGKKKPNDWGLYDMHGNVWEWCRDAYRAELRADTDPEVNEGDHRVYRGGGYKNPANFCQLQYRYRAVPTDSSEQQGFRVVVVPDGLQLNVEFKVMNIENPTVNDVRFHIWKITGRGKATRSGTVKLEDYEKGPFVLTVGNIYTKENGSFTSKTIKTITSRKDPKVNDNGIAISVGSERWEILEVMNSQMAFVNSDFEYFRCERLSGHKAREFQKQLNEYLKKHSEKK